MRESLAVGSVQVSLSQAGLGGTTDHSQYTLCAQCGRVIGQDLPFFQDSLIF